MAWLDVRVIKDRFGDKAGGPATAERVIYAQADAPVSADAALSASHGGTVVPAIGASYSTSRPFCRVVDRQVERLSPTQFNVTARYEDPTDGTPEEEVDLLDQPARITQSSNTTMEAYTVDAEGEQVRNKAGEPFDTMPERLGGGRTYVIRKYVDAAKKAQIEAAERTTNSAPLAINGRSHAADTLLLAEAGFEAEGTIFLASLVVMYAPGGWADKALNVGFTELASGKRKQITEDGPDGQPVPVTRAWPLNLDGTKKSAPDADAEVLTFYPYPVHAWTGVPLA